MNEGQIDPKQKHQHPRIECGLCGMHISQKHLGRHRIRRHPNCPSVDKMIDLTVNRSAQPPQPVVSTSRGVASKNVTKPMDAEIRQAIEVQSQKPYSDVVRFVKVRMSEQELIRLMKRGRIYHAVGKFFMYDS